MGVFETRETTTHEFQRRHRGLLVEEGKKLNLYRSSGASCSLRTSYSRIFSVTVRNLVGVNS